MPDTPGASDSAPPFRRSSDPDALFTAGPGGTDDPEQLLQALRAGGVALEAIAPRLPLGVVFAWHAQGRLSQAEFFALLAHQDIDEVEISDAPPERNPATEETQRQKLAISGFNARIDALGVQVALDAVTEIQLNPILQAATPHAEGIGLRMLFARRDETEGSEPRDKPAALVVTCRAYIGSRGTQQVVKCEAVFSGTTMPSERYCRIALPLPIFCGGRRRLTGSVRDIQTAKALELPPEASELFHEKHMVALKVMSKTPLPTGGLGSAVKGAIGGLFGR